MKLAAAALVATIGLVWSQVATAAPLAPLGPLPLAPATTLVEPVHGYHTSCQLGPAGWHRSTRAGRIPCGRHCYIGRFGRRICVWR